MSKFSTATKLTENSVQKIVAKQQFSGINFVKRLSIAISMAATLVSLVNATPADAGTVTGTVTGTWNNYAQGDFTLGDPFTATYSYDDTTISPYGYSQTDYSYSGFSAPLLSLLVSSGSYSHQFDFSTGSGYFNFQDYALTAPTYNSYSYKLAQVAASDTSGSETNYFHAYRYPGQSNGTPFLNEVAQAYTYDSSTNTYSNYVYTTSNVNFTPDITAPTTAIPTPALLPGMVAFGLGMWRKRKAVAAEQV